MSPRVSNVSHYRVRYSLQMAPGAASGSLDSSPGSRDARRGASSLARRGLWRRGTPARSPQWCRVLPVDGVAQSGARSSPPLPPGAEPGFRGLNPMSQDARVAAGSLVPRGGSGGLTSWRSQLGCGAALVDGGDHTRLGLPPPLPMGAAQGSQDSRAVVPPPPFRRRRRTKTMHLARRQLG